MNELFRPVFVLAIVAFFSVTAMQAGGDEKMIIALKTDSDALVTTDVSELAIGEAKTIETDNGEVIDILRTADGAEIYINGELLEMDFTSESEGDQRAMKKHVKIICEAGQECNEEEIVITGDGSTHLNWVSEDGEHVIIREEVELNCGDEDPECKDRMIWVTEGEEIDVEAISDLHQDGEDQRVVVIRKKIITED